MLRTTTGILTCVLGLGLAMPGLAWRAEAERLSKVREAPSRDAPALWVLYSGEKVSVDRCEDGYCFIRRNSREGWVKLSVLDRKRPPKSRPQEAVPDDDYDDGGGESGGNEGGDNGGGGDDDCVYYYKTMPEQAEGEGQGEDIKAISEPCDE